MTYVTESSMKTMQTSILMLAMMLTGNDVTKMLTSIKANDAKCRKCISMMRTATEMANVTETNLMTMQTIMLMLATI